MTVKEIIKELSRYNENADFEIVVNGCPQDFEICYGYSDGCTPANCECIHFMVNTVVENI